MVPADGIEYFAAAAGDSPIPAGMKLSPGQLLSVPQPAWFHPDVDPGLEPAGLASLKILIIARTADILLVNKPHGLPATPQGRVVWNCAQSRLRRELGEPDLVAVHRLDRLTGGLLLFSRRQSTRGLLHTQFERREVAKTYEAIAPTDAVVPGQGAVEEEPMLVELRMRKVKHDPQVKVVAEGDKITRTWIRKLPATASSAAGMSGEPDEGLARYELRPITGHTHQLRVLMNHCGAPIVGDDTYPSYKLRPWEQLTPAMGLSATMLGVTVPGEGYREFRLR